MPNDSNKLTSDEREELAHPTLEPTVSTCVKALKYIEELERELYSERKQRTLLAVLQKRVTMALFELRCAQQFIPQAPAYVKRSIAFLEGSCEI